MLLRTPARHSAARRNNVDLQKVSAVFQYQRWVTCSCYGVRRDWPGPLGRADLTSSWSVLTAKHSPRFSNYDSNESKAPLTVRFAARLSYCRFWAVQRSRERRLLRERLAATGREAKFASGESRHRNCGAE